MAAIHFTAIPYEPNAANRRREKIFFFAKFVPTQTTLYLLGFELLEVLCAFL